ncbi:MAG: anhydro-N-acetylmuramic acid kinase, partial [Flavobacteriales bacterium]
MKELRIIGLMSGTSLDGLDLAACTFTFDNQWCFTINHCKTVAYSMSLKSALQCLDTSTAFEYARTDHELGRFFGSEVNKFISEIDFDADYISSHGHTIFHQPEINLTTQIGHPSAIAALTEIPVI